MTLPPVAPDPLAAPVACDLSGLAVLAAAGPDAAEFLHGQLSSDVKSLLPGQGRYTSYNSPKGRMLMNGFAWRHPEPAGERYGVLCAADLGEPMRKRLALFVLRAKVALTDATPSLARMGVAGAHVAEAIRAAFGSVPAPGTVAPVDADGTLVLALPDGRFVVLARAPGDAVRAALARHAASADEAAWRLAGIRAGVPLVTAATSDRLIAQTANWELLGGVDFRKGCYPGQEIVARMQYLGRLKERAQRFRAATAPAAAGTALVQGATGEAAGIVVDAAPLPGGGSELLAVVELAALQRGPLRLGAADGPPLEPLPLPYAIPEPEPARGRSA